MKCPNCGASSGRVPRACRACGGIYDIDKALEISQLEFLLTEVATWPEADIRSKPYAERLAALRARLAEKPQTTDEAPMQPVIGVAEPAKLPTELKIESTSAQPAVGLTDPAALPAKPKIEPAPVRPQVPFDQWLLSERNIKIALYSGGMLLVLAGLIFVSVNWGNISGPAKFAVTLLVTGLMYLGGYTLFKRQSLRLGGIALLGIGSGFVPLNFVVLQIYIFSARGLSASVMWLLGSLPTFLLYVSTAYWTRADLFVYFSAGALLSTLTAALFLLNAPFMVYLLAYALLLLVLLLAARALQPTQFASFTLTPLLIVSQIGLPLISIFSLYIVVMQVGGCGLCTDVQLGLTTMFLGVVFYVAASVLFNWIIARFVAAAMFAVTVVLLLTALRFSNLATGITLMALAFVYICLGVVLERRAGKRNAGRPLYIPAYFVAAFVTAQSLSDFGSNPGHLALALIGDVVLFALSAWVHRRYEWMYGATWLLIAPVGIYADTFLHSFVSQGLVLGVMLLNYVAIGYILGRRRFNLGAPFLSAAAFLSLLVPLMTWSRPVIVSIFLAIIAALYLFVALWRRWPWLLLASLAAVNTVVFSVASNVFSLSSYTLTAIYAGLGIVLTLGGIGLQRSGRNMWMWPLYLVAIADIGLSYCVALLLGGWLAIGTSVVFAALAFGLAWEERGAWVSPITTKMLPFFTYCGVALLFVGHFYLIGLSGQAWSWPPYTATLCAFLIATAWFLRTETTKDIYGTPLRWSGTVLLLLPLMGAFAISIPSNRPLLGAVTFAIGAAAYAADALVRRILLLGYLAGGLFVGVIWELLRFLGFTELQAYIFPLGLALLLLSWNERRRGGAGYQLATILGLLVFMGSAFYQSFGNVWYAVLLLGESLAAFAWGMQIRSRGYVQVAGIALLANAVMQLGPGFVHLSRWLQLAIIGAILLGAGLMALFRREQLLLVRKNLSNEWRQWQA